MRAETRNKRVAVAVSIGLHLVVFGALAAGGVFTFLQSKAQPAPVEVTMYDDDAASTTPAPGSTAASPAAGGNSSGESYQVPQQMPEINETFTQEVATQREIKQVMQQQGVDAEKAKAVVAEKQLAVTGKIVAADGGSANSGQTASGSGKADAAGDSSSGGSAGTGSGIGTGSAGAGNGGSGAGTAPAKPARPPQRARLISQPDAAAYYPESLRKQNVSATVVLSLQISADGSVTSATVVSSSGYGEMDAAAVQLAYACRYEPARDENGNAVATTKGLTVPFQTQ